MNVRLNWKNLFPSHNGQFSVGRNTDIQVEHLRERFVEIFKPELGTVQGVTLKLLLQRKCQIIVQTGSSSTLRPSLCRG